MAEGNPSTPSASAPCCAQGACCAPGACCACPCVDRLARLERTVCRLRLWLLVALGVLILVVGIAIGAGGARREAMRGGGPGRPGMPGPGPQAMPMHQGPMGQPAGGHGAGGPAPRMPEGAGPGPRERRGRGGDR